jgi:hypothetical protein
MLGRKKKQKAVVEALKKDSAAVKEFLLSLKVNHEQTFSDEEKQALEAIDKYLENLGIFFAGFEKGLR